MYLASFFVIDIWYDYLAYNMLVKKQRNKL